MRNLLSIGLILCLSACTSLDFKKLFLSKEQYVLQAQVIEVYVAFNKAQSSTDQRIQLTEKHHAYIKPMPVLNAFDISSAGYFQDKKGDSYIVLNLPLESTVKISKQKWVQGWIIKVNGKVVSAQATVGSKKKRFIFRVKDEQVAKEIIQLLSPSS